ncbi:ATP-binding cassette domain-containing protein [Nonomuraea sp. NPDC049655]|uniref:ATP-binding cassette domain-containing protein n=1 Tax=Nonomuraea sp. NPDC049655 TaxID=3364355 RepID=UPI003790FB72
MDVRTVTGAEADRRQAVRPWRFLAGLLRARRRPLLLALAWSLVESAPALLAGLLVATAVDRGFLAGRPGVGLAWLGLLGATMVVRSVATRLMFPQLAAVVEPMRDELVRAVAGATVRRAADGGQAPDAAALSRLTGQVETMRKLVSTMLRTSRELGMSVIAALVGLLVLSPVAAAVAAGPLVLTLAAFARLMPALTARQRALVLAEERLTAQATPIVAGLRDVAACGARAQAADTLRALVSAQAAAARALAWAGTGRRVAVLLGAHAPLVGLLLLSRPLIEGGRLSAGEVVGAVTYLFTGLEPALRTILDTLGGWGVGLAATTRRIAETIAVPGPAAAGTPATAVPDGHELRAERLTFAYAARATPVVRDLDLTIGEGGHLAVVGPSGVGKSTLALLMTGLLRPTGGRVRLGGRPLDSIPGASVRSRIALVPQEAYVFAGTVRENLAYLWPLGESPDDERLRASVAAVGAGPLVERLGGLDGEIDEPSALSAGERQLVALARVHASPAGVLILDEAGCHLDPAAELRAESALAARPGTLVVIAHRISSAARARQVLLMDGTTVLTGTHRELIDRSPLYADLVGRWHDDGTR